MDISWLGLGISMALLALPVWMFHRKRVPMIKPLGVAILRMLVQFAVIGLILEFLFNEGNLWTTMGWMMVMIIAAAYTAINRLGLGWRILLPVVAVPLVVTSVITMPFLALAVMRPDPLWKPEVLIPVFGMILGNSMNGTALALERYYRELNSNIKEYLTYLSFGATTAEATLPFFQQSFRTAMMPRLMNISAMGIISLPGMMSGLMVAGKSPLVAIKYQIVIIISIFSAVALTVYLTLCLFTGRMFDRAGLPHDWVVRELKD